ncbi:hypothetical protein N7491_008854 [Penicillium cf. griseofulvum]|nr:hypothetical protein N7491_008854 [Penicillium cf. griseofulvum]
MSQKPHNVFLINELLENILLHTDMRTLLTSAQRVSRTWSTMIKTSVKLQESLFFKPSKFEISDPPPAPSQSTPRRHPLGSILPQAASNLRVKNRRYKQISTTGTGASQAQDLSSKRRQLETNAAATTTGINNRSP